jgi:hypothetical protein
MLCQPSGLSGSTSSNSSIILPGTLLLISHHSLCSIHPVFHVSQLKKAVPVTHQAQPLPANLDGMQVPEQVLQKRVATSGDTVRLQALIKWTGMPSTLAT